MGILTWRETRKTKEQVKGLRRDLAERAAAVPTGSPLASTPEQRLRLAAANERYREITAKLQAAGVDVSRRGIAKNERAAAVVQSAWRHIVQDGMTIDEGVAAAVEESAAIAL